MTKQELYNYLMSIGVLNKNGGRKYCWNKLLVDDALKYFIEYSKNYRSDEEAWFCLSNMIEPYKCEICGNLAKFTGSKKSKIKGYNTVCNNCSANAVKSKIDKITNKLKQRTDTDKKISNEKRKKTCLEKYGDENYSQFGSQSFKNNLLEKYGDENYNNREQAKQTCLERYGVDHNFKVVGFTEKSVKTKREKYGNASNYEKTKKTNLIKYGVEHPGQSAEIQNKIRESKRINVSKIENEFNCTQERKLFKQYGQGWKVLDLCKLYIHGRAFISNDDIPLIQKYFNEGTHTNKYISKKEKDLLAYIKSIYNGKVLENVTNIVSNNNHRYYELDIYLPDLNLAFDFNGTYYHSDLYKDKYYHQRKTINCYNQNVQLIHIYEYDWDNNNDEIKTKIFRTIENINNGEQYGWITLKNFNKYALGEPEIIFENGYKLYNEGKFNLI